MMHRISPDNPVRRRLFVELIANQATVENTINAINESIAVDKFEKMKKWNFDFEKETPLEGVYEWIPYDDGSSWIGVHDQTQKKDIKLSSVDDIDLVQMKYENEFTPRTNKVESGELMLRKRRKGMENPLGDDERAVKRKLSF